MKTRRRLLSSLDPATRSIGSRPGSSTNGRRSLCRGRRHHAPLRVHRGRNRQGRRCARSKASACRSAGHSAPGEVSGPCCQARSPLARRGLHCRPDGPTRAIHRGRAWSRCRSLHAAPLCSTGREGAPANLRTHQERPRLSQAARHEAGQSDERRPGSSVLGAMFRSKRPISLPRAFCRSSPRCRRRASQASGALRLR